MKWLALVLLALAAILAAPRSEATTTCGITSITSLTFGVVDPTGTLVDTNATLNYSCTYTGALSALFGTYVTACANIGPDALGNIATRTMVDASADLMQFQVYKDPSRTAIWGTTGNATYTSLQFTRSVGILSGTTTFTGALPVYGRVPALQSQLSPGTYTGLLSGVSLTYSYNEALLAIGAPPAACNAGGNGGAAVTTTATTLSAQASVVPLCTIAAASDLDFGSVSGLLRTQTDKTSLLRITCTNRAAFQIGLNNGVNASGSVRRMAAGTRYVNYELYRDSQRTLRWGTSIGTDTSGNTGTGAEVQYTVFGRVPVQPAVQAGSYSDTVTVTVTY